MRFSEVILRLSCSLVAWMLLYAHALWLAVVNRVGCGPDGDQLYRVVLGLALLAIGASFALAVTRPFSEVHRILRWLALPLALLLPLAITTVWQVAGRVYRDNQSLCAESAATFWEYAWPPVQAVAAACVIVRIVFVWRAPRQ